jgi:ABC-type amino acid transport substrate-binding protein
MSRSARRFRHRDGTSDRARTGVSLEFLAIGRPEIAARLDEGSCDLVVSGTVITPELASRVQQSTPVMDLTLALVVPDERREEFATWDDIRRHSRLRLGLGPSEYYRRQMAVLLPDAEVVPLDSPRDFFTGDPTAVDALVTATEVGSAWTLVYPRYSVAVPLPDRITVPVGYAMPYGEPRLTEFIDAVIRLKIADGTTARLFAYWYEGRSPSGQRRRWSIVRDVLGWVE